MKVLGVQISSFLCQQPHCFLLSPAHGSMERSPAFVVLNVQVHVLREKEVQYLCVSIGRCHVELGERRERSEISIKRTVKHNVLVSIVFVKRLQINTNSSMGYITTWRLRLSGNRAMRKLGLKDFATHCTGAVFILKVEGAAMFHTVLEVCQHCLRHRHANVLQYIISVA